MTEETTEQEAPDPALEGVKAERDPIEQMDMHGELDELRKLFSGRGYQRKGSQANAEVWQNNLGGQPGYRIVLMSDQGGRIRAVFYNPVGQQLAEVSPAFPVDVEAAMTKIGA